MLILSKLTRFLRLQHLCSMCLSAIAFAAADVHPWLRLKKSKQALTQTRILSAQLLAARLHETLEFPNNRPSFSAKSDSFILSSTPIKSQNPDTPLLAKRNGLRRVITSVADTEPITKMESSANFGIDQRFLTSSHTCRTKAEAFGRVWRRRKSDEGGFILLAVPWLLSDGRSKSFHPSFGAFVIFAAKNEFVFLRFRG